jgi:threonine aldolase
MRQAGILAAAGIVALEEMTERLCEDHDNARKLAEGLAEIRGLSLNPESIRSNIVFFDLTREDMGAQELAQRLEKSGVRVIPLGPGKRLRAVTHYHITSEDITQALAVFRKVTAG